MMRLEKRVLLERRAGFLRFLDGWKVRKAHEADGRVRHERADFAQLSRVGRRNQQVMHGGSAFRWHLGPAGPALLAENVADVASLQRDQLADAGVAEVEQAVQRLAPERHRFG